MPSPEQDIVTVLAELVSDGGTALVQRAGPQALAYAHAIEGEIVPRLEAQPAYAPLWQQFQAQPQVLAPALVGLVQVLVQGDPALPARLETLLHEFRQARQAHTPGSQETRTVTASGERSAAIGGDASGATFNMGDRINTGGGAYVGGNVNTGGGAFTGGNSYHIQGDGNVIGNDNILTLSQSPGADAVALAQAFGQLYAAIQQSPQLTPAQQTAARQEVVALQRAATAQGDKVAEGFIRERLHNLQRMAPDILDVILTTFANPVVGAGMVIKKIAQKMKEEASEKK